MVEGESNRKVVKSEHEIEKRRASWQPGAMKKRQSVEDKTAEILG